MNYLAIFIGSGLGGVLRFVMTRFAYRFVQHFPLGTLVVNVVACFLVGFFIEAMKEKMKSDSTVVLFLTIGFCGGFSTFSTFSYDTLGMFGNQSFLQGFANIGLSVVLCLLFTFFGIASAKLL